MQLILLRRFLEIKDSRMTIRDETKVSRYDREGNRIRTNERCVPDNQQPQDESFEMAPLQTAETQQEEGQIDESDAD